MIKIGRNDPCPCQSGQKYKKCCWLLHEAATREALRVRRLPPADYEQIQAEMAELNDLSMRTGAAIRAGDFEQAERLCAELRDRYVDQIDYIERRAELLEARGEWPAALLWHRKALLFAQMKDGFDDEGIAARQEHIAKLQAKTRLLSDQL